MTQIIRTVRELEALDLDTMLMKQDRGLGIPYVGMALEWLVGCEFDADYVFPLVVIATGEQVRAARQALKEQG